mmetsp:Transcript_8651/g.17559  ORF Transcript_8651/g.17559 Transcript_8651/m.17559 type:complete len:666 (-) Transcript_8651:1827-3824(-)
MLEGFVSGGDVVQGLKYGRWDGGRCRCVGLRRRVSVSQIAGLRMCKVGGEGGPEQDGSRAGRVAGWGRKIWEKVSQPVVMTGPAKWVVIGLAPLLVAFNLSLVAVGVVVAATDAGREMPSLLTQVREKVTLFDLILEDIAAGFVEEVDLDKFFETGMNAMLSELDPYTQFENESQTRDLSLLTDGRYGGVGLVIALHPSREHEIVVVNAFEDYAWKRGVRPGDTLVSVDGMLVKELKTEKVSELLRGPPGSVVHIAVRREGLKEPIEVLLPRSEVKVHDVSAYGLIGNPSDEIGYIKLHSFGANAALDMKTALENLRSDKLRGLVLDLRGNPGGLLNAAVEVAECFVPRDSIIVSAKGRVMGLDTVYRSENEPVVPPSVRLVVLVDGTTASASEILSGAVQDYDLGVIVGSRTYGKGLIQNIEHLPYDTSLKFTVGRYYTPSGRCLQDKKYAEGKVVVVEDSERKAFKTKNGRTVMDAGGIVPDVELPASKMSELENALSEQGLFFLYANRFAASHKDLDRITEITQETYQDFQNFVRNEASFVYRTRFDEGINSLETALKNAGFSVASGEVGDVKKAVQEELVDEFSNQRKSIEDRLLDAIQGRYLPESKKIMTLLPRDNQVQKALDILRSPFSYSALLNPSEGKPLRKGMSSLFPGDNFRFRN